jgi:hypothetical protein
MMRVEATGQKCETPRVHGSLAEVPEEGLEPPTRGL